MNKPGDEPAFPAHVTEQVYTGETRSGFEEEVRLRGGLSKRELFAAMAMQGLITGHCITGAPTPDENELAVDSTSIADALLAELAKERS